MLAATASLPPRPRYTRCVHALCVYGARCAPSCLGSLTPRGMLLPLRKRPAAPAHRRQQRALLGMRRARWRAG
jgi:hypothetical protein